MNLLASRASELAAVETCPIPRCSAKRTAASMRALPTPLRRNSGNTWGETASTVGSRLSGVREVACRKTAPRPCRPPQRRLPAVPCTHQPGQAPRPHRRAAHRRHRYAGCPPTALAARSRRRGPAQRTVTGDRDMKPPMVDVQHAVPVTGFDPANEGDLTPLDGVWGQSPANREKSAGEALTAALFFPLECRERRESGPDVQYFVQHCLAHCEVGHGRSVCSCRFPSLLELC